MICFEQLFPSPLQAPAHSARPAQATDSLHSLTHTEAVLGEEERWARPAPAVVSLHRASLRAPAHSARPARRNASLLTHKGFLLLPAVPAHLLLRLLLLHPLCPLLCRPLLGAEASQRAQRTLASKIFFSRFSLSLSKQPLACSVAARR